jgi:Uma2 family endonuclease
MTISAAKFTVEDYHHLIETGMLKNRPVELLAGLIVDMSPEGPIHVHCIRQIAKFFRNALSDDTVSEAHPVTLSNSEPEPDIAIIIPQDYRDRHPSSQDIHLIIEVAYSSLSKDLNEKVEVYAGAGISEYWLVDLFNDRVLVMRQPQAESYQLTQEYTSEMITPLKFPALNVPVELLLGN